MFCELLHKHVMRHVHTIMRTRFMPVLHRPRPRVFLHTAVAAGSNPAGYQDLLLGTIMFVLYYSLDHSFEPLTTFSGTQKSIAASDAMAAKAPACTAVALEGAGAGGTGHDASRAAPAQPVHSIFWYSTEERVTSSAAAVRLSPTVSPWSIS